MFESIMNFFKNLRKTESKEPKSKNTAKERLHLVLMQDRANVSADFLEMMKQEIIEVIKKYIEVDEKEIDVRLTNGVKEDGTTEAPALYANIPIRNIKNEMKKEVLKEEPQETTKTNKEEDPEEDKKEEIKEVEEEKEEDNDNEENKEETDLEDCKDETNIEESTGETDIEESKEETEAKEKPETEQQNNSEESNS